MRFLVPIALAASLSLSTAAPATAAPYLPPKGKVFHGVTAGFDVADFRARTGKSPAIWQHFVRWGGSLNYAFDNSHRAGARTMLHISTAKGQNMPGVISPGGIARGDGDGFLVGLNRLMAAQGEPVYVRLMGEMNNCDNAYAPLNCNGSRRNGDHSAATFKRAWRRAVVILRGGPIDAVNAKLRANRLAPVQGRASDLPRAQVSFVWAPMTGGSPMVAALDPQRFWPGRRWVDWVGTSFYSRYPNFHWLQGYYDRFAVRHNKPFAIAEWAMWGSDNAGFARQLFSWVRGHGRVRMVQYNQGSQAGGPFRLDGYPRSTGVIRNALRSPRFLGL